MIQRPVILPSLCWNRRHADFYAVTSSVSSHGIAFRSATVPGRGDVLTCSIRYVGSIEVRIVETGRHSFTVKPTAGRRRSTALVRTLVELARIQEYPPERHRAQPRIVPLQVAVSVAMEDGSILSGRIANVSATGVALHVGIPIAPRTRIRVGSTEAVVVRTYDNGIGASFRTPFDPIEVNESLVL